MTDELDDTGFEEIGGMVQEGDDYFMVTDSGTRVKMPKEAWEAMKEYRKGLGITD